MLLRLKETNMPLKDMRYYADMRAKGEVTYSQRMMLLREHLQRLDKTMTGLLENRWKLIAKIHFYEAALSKK